MKKLVLSAIMTMLLLVSSLYLFAQPTPPSGQQWQLVFNEDFNNFNSNEWGRGSTPWGSENQSSCNLIPPGNTDAWVSGGNLTLRARSGSFTGESGTVYPYTSGWAWMKNWRTYGYIEIQAFFPTHQGAWPAFWMLGDGWPPEFDIAEWRGAPRNYMTTAFYNGTWYTATHSMDPSGWHTYGINWQPNYLRFYIDGQLVHSYNGTTPSQPMYVILSNGTDCNDGDGSGLPSYFNVNYVRWYQLNSTGGGITPGQTYRISVRNSGRALDAGGTANNSPVQVYDYWGGNNQKWTVQSASGGYYQLVNVASGRALDAGGIANNSPVQVYSYWGGNNQQWSINNLGDGYFSILNRASGRALDINGTANNSPCIIYDYWGGQNQQFQFELVGSGSRIEGSPEIGGPEEKVLVFPNPVEDVLSLTLPEKYQDPEIVIINSAGEIVVSAIDPDAQEIGLSGLNRGVYFLRISNGTEVKTLKFLKK